MNEWTDRCMGGICVISAVSRVANNSVWITALRGWPVGWLIGWLVGALVGWLVGGRVRACAVGRRCQWVVGWVVEIPVCHHLSYQLLKLPRWWSAARAPPELFTGPSDPSIHPVCARVPFWTSNSTSLRVHSLATDLFLFLDFELSTNWNRSLLCSLLRSLVP